VHLINDVDTVIADLRGDAHLFYQNPYVVHSIVGCSIEFVYVVRLVFVE
jgi:hypothetical protein